MSTKRPSTNLLSNADGSVVGIDGIGEYDERIRCWTDVWDDLHGAGWLVGSTSHNPTCTEESMIAWGGGGAEPTVRETHWIILVMLLIVLIHAGAY